MRCHAGKPVCKAPSYLNMTKSAAVQRVRGNPHKRCVGSKLLLCVMEESGPAVLDCPSPGLSLAPVQLKRKQGKLHKETSSCSLAALTGG